MVSPKISLLGLTREALDLFEDCELFLDPDSGEHRTYMTDDVRDAVDSLRDPHRGSRGDAGEGDVVDPDSPAAIRKVHDQWLEVPTPGSGEDERRIERFIGSTPKAARDRLREAFSGKGRFRKFRRELYQLKIGDAWEAYRIRDHAAVILSWCEDHGVVVDDDVDREAVEIEVPLAPADVVRAFAQAITDGDLDDVRMRLGSDVVYHDSIGKQIHGVRAVLECLRERIADAPGYTMSVDRCLDQGEVVCAFGSISGSVIGGGPGARVQRFRGPAAWEATIRAQQIVEWREYADHGAVRASQRGGEE